MDSEELKKVLKVADSLDWGVAHENGEFEFQKCSPAGQDFNMNIIAETLYDLIDKLHIRYNDFDCSEEAYLWLDNTGHGKNGAPYDMKDLYEDVEACQEMILELANALEEE